MPTPKERKTEAVSPDEWDVIYARIIERIARGEQVIVDKALFTAIYTTLMGAVDSLISEPEDLLTGMGPLYTGLRENLYHFAAGKTVHQLIAVNGLLVRPDGGVVPFNEFREAAMKELGQYNQNWLRTEYENALQQTINAQQWQQIEAKKDLFPYLQYRTAGDNAVRPEHAALDKIVRKVDDAFWDTYMPQNAHNCRCRVKTLRTAEETPDEVLLTVPPLADQWAFNPGKTKQVFSPQHPYFTELSTALRLIDRPY